MIIANSTLSMQSKRSYLSYSSATVSIQTDALNNDNSKELINEQELSYSSQSSQRDSGENASSSKKVSFSRKQQQTQIISHTIPQIDIKEETKNLESIRQQCIVYLWACLFGEKRAMELADKYSLSIPRNLQNKNTLDFRTNDLSVPSVPSVKENTQEIVDLSKSVQSEGSTISYLGKNILVSGTNTGAPKLVKERFFTENETTSFSTTGTVITADGKQLSFHLDLTMSRSFTAYNTESFASAADFIDPLVINLNGNIAQVSDQHFFFDLDEDGIDDKISRLSSDSGYLALDLNQDGVINDGGELLGTKSGNGFIDLAKYDGDNNGWIDEQDEIWNKLKIWVQNEDGSNQLLTLKEGGVGAICLQNASTDFSQRDAVGHTLAAIRRTGIFLYENGLAGTIQHLDLAKNTSDLYA